MEQTGVTVLRMTIRLLYRLIMGPHKPYTSHETVISIHKDHQDILACLVWIAALFALFFFLVLLPASAPSARAPMNAPPRVQTLASHSQARQRRYPASTTIGAFWRSCGQAPPYLLRDRWSVPRERANGRLTSVRCWCPACEHANGRHPACESAN